MNLLPQFFYGMVVIGSLSMVGDGAGVGGRWEGVGRALGGRWGGGRWGGGRLIYRQIKLLHCSGYLLVSPYILIMCSVCLLVWCVCVWCDRTGTEN